MTKCLLFPLLAMVTLFYISGCSEKFHVAAPYKNYTVVYAYLDMTDTAHYIRIQKAFLDENKNALTMAQTSDSNFYANLDVKIERVDFSSVIHDVIHLKRVNLDQEGYPKQPGQFFQSPNYAYKFTDPLDPQFIYRIVITNPATSQADSADAPVIDDINPAAFYIDKLDLSLNPPPLMDFSSTLSNRFFEITGYYVPQTPGFTYIFQGQTYSNPAVISQAFIRFNWDDSDGNTQVHTPHYFDFNAGYQSFTNGNFDYQIHNTQLYAALASASGMGAAPPNQYRLLNRCDIFMYVGTPDFVAYQQSSLTQGTGLTGTEIEPLYTNIKGANVLGLYTSRGMRTGKITLTPATVDSLIISPLLSQAHIVGTVYH